MNRYAGYGFVENDPKTKRSKRKIVLPDIAIKTLEEHRERQEQARLKAGEKWKGKGLVFCTQFGGFTTPTYITRCFQSLLKKAGLPKIDFHDLRHSAATILLVMGVHPKIVQELLGHSTISMTLDTYSHLLPTIQKEAAEKMDQAFKQDD
jgi:integrase